MDNENLKDRIAIAEQINELQTEINSYITRRFKNQVNEEYFTSLISEEIDKINTLCNQYHRLKNESENGKSWCHYQLYHGMNLDDYFYKPSCSLNITINDTELNGVQNCPYCKYPILFNNDPLKVINHF